VTFSAFLSVCRSHERDSINQLRQGCRAILRRPPLSRSRHVSRSISSSMSGNDSGNLVNGPRLTLSLSFLMRNSSKSFGSLYRQVFQRGWEKNFSASEWNFAHCETRRARRETFPAQVLRKLRGRGDTVIRWDRRKTSAAETEPGAEKGTDLGFSRHFFDDISFISREDDGAFSLALCARSIGKYDRKRQRPPREHVVESAPLRSRQHRAQHITRALTKRHCA